MSVCRVVVILAAAAVLPGCSKKSGGSSADVVLATAGSSLSDRAAGVLAIDPTYVYWADGYRGDARVVRVPKAGGKAETVAKIGENIGALALDDANVYVATEESVLRIAKSGGAPTKLAATKTTCFSSCGIAVDASNVYFTAETAVRRVPKAGGAVASVADGHDQPQTVALDDANVYWFDFVGHDIWRAPKSGTVAATKVASGPSIDGPDPRIVVSAGQVYWLSGRVVYVAPSAGGAPREIANTGPHFHGFDVDDANVYFARAVVRDEATSLRSAAGGILRVPKNGGAAVPVFLGSADPKAIAIDASSIYWIGIGTIVKTPKPP